MEKEFKTFEELLSLAPQSVKDELERLNPDHMTSGYWYANPGDVVNVQ